MRQASALSANVIRFPGPRAVARRQPNDSRSLLDIVYTNGSFMVAADDRETKALATRLQVFGFLNIAEVANDGSARRLKPSEVAGLPVDRPWRLSRPSFDELPPLAG